MLREHGVMMGKIVFDDDPDNVPQAAYAGVNYVDKVSCREVIRYNTGEGRKKVSTKAATLHPQRIKPSVQTQKRVSPLGDTLSLYTLYF